MKITIEVSDALMLEATSLSPAHNITSYALVEQGSEQVLCDLTESKPYKLKDASVTGQGLQPGQEALSWADVRDMIYEGRGT